MKDLKFESDVPVPMNPSVYCEPINLRFPNYVSNEVFRHEIVCRKT